MENPSYTSQSHITTQSYQDKVLSTSENPNDFPEMKRMYNEIVAIDAKSKAETRDNIDGLKTEILYPNASFDIPHETVGDYDTYLSQQHTEYTPVNIEENSTLQSYDIYYAPELIDPVRYSVADYTSISMPTNPLPIAETYYEGLTPIEETDNMIHAGSYEDYLASISN